ncbi:MAG: squalene--hopene cyclase, partial [Verrucomicrobiales bacterium]
RNPIARILRSLSRQKTLRVLEGIQPRSGGFLEATPLTSFVCMSLGASGQSGSQVAKAGAQFLRASVLPDGSWPIDTNLATWATTLAVQALGSEGIQDLNSAQRSQLLRWFLDQQYKTIHPYTQAAPGGWAWTNLSGGVPDADDTSSALLALAELDPSGKETSSAATAGAEWLLGLQNGDGGIPTFCRGWTHLPFDQSSPDITAHAIRAWMAWQLKLPASLQKRVAIALKQATDYLLKAQQSDGSWIPLWFGNQHEPEEENRTYGVCKVLQGLLAIGRAGPPQVAKAIRNGIAYLVRTQSSSGGWSGGFSSHVSVEETALTVETLGKLQTAGQLTPEAATALDDGLDWLVRKVLSDDWTTPSSIGFYFAKLWYYERLYPIIFTTGALQQARARLLPGSSLASHASPP